MSWFLTLLSVTPLLENLDGDTASLRIGDECIVDPARTIEGLSHVCAVALHIEKSCLTGDKLAAGDANF